MRNILVLSVLLAVGACGTVGAQTAGPEHLSYEDFLEKVRADQVKSLTMRPLQYLEGTYLDGDQEKQFFAKRPLEAGSDPLLNELLEKHEVSVVRKDPPEPSTMEQLAQNAPLFILLVPPVLMVVVLVYLVRLNNKINQVIIR
jgi:ATP-dependent Zn protease